MKKKKILFVTTRSPFSHIISGDRYRAKLIIDYLGNKNKIDVLYSDNFKGIKKINGKKIFFKTKIFDKLKGILYSLISFSPLQNGFFYCENVNNYLNKNYKKYNTIIFHTIRSAQYLPDKFKGKKILEMTDLLSNRYDQIIKSLSIFNPLFYIYWMEKLLVKKYENYCALKFKKIILVSINDIKNIFYIKNKKNFIEIPNSFEINKYIYKFKTSNNKILFVGNMKYLPNRNACKNFIESILPKIKNINPYIQFHIVGEIKPIDKFFFNNIKNVFCHGSVKKLDNLIKSSVCGICNLSIATGLQNKILTYLSYGLPCISSEISFKNTYLKKNKEILVYKDQKELIKLFLKLKNDKTFSNKISRSSYLAVKKKYAKKKILISYKKII